jgi:cyclopropane fatty-acyl-phospholipid synthase-like methyltransferase
MPDYHGACAALAGAVARAAGVQPGDRILSVACGDGEELRLWVQHFGAGSVLGVEADPARVARAVSGTAMLPGVALRQGSGTRLAELGLPPGSFDRVLCVDAAYHLTPRSAFLDGAFALLRPGGTLACTDLVADAGPGRHRRRLDAAAWLCGLGAGSLADGPGHLQRLQQAGFAETRLERLDEAVLTGFARFAEAQARRLGRMPRAWWRVAATAWLIPRCRAAGLGYAMLSATRPMAGVADAGSAASSREATDRAERTALSSSGTPASA